MTRFFNELFWDLRESTTAEAFGVSISPRTSGFVLELPHRRTEYPDFSQLVGGVVSGISRIVLDSEADLLHLHAGGVTLNGGTVLLVGPSGSGKTTTTVALCSRGWNYLSDETVAIWADELVTATWPKPLSVKREGFQLFEDLTHHHLGTSDPITTREFVSASQLGFDVGVPAEPKMIVLLDVDGSLTTSPTPAELVIHLIESSHDFGRFGEGGLRRLAALATSCRSVVIKRSTPEAMAEEVEAAWESCSAETVHAQVVDLTTDVMIEGVSVVSVGEELVVHNRKSGRTATLNSAGSETFQRLAGQGFDSSMASSEERRFTADLRSAGLL